jgi:hypothetical protein
MERAAQPLERIASARGVLIVGGLAWTTAFGIWWAPTLWKWWHCYEWASGDRALLSPTGCSEHFVQDLPFKLIAPTALLVAGYLVVVALAVLLAIAREHADMVLGPTPCRHRHR